MVWAGDGPLRGVVVAEGAPTCGAMRRPLSFGVERKGDASWCVKYALHQCTVRAKAPTACSLEQVGVRFERGAEDVCMCVCVCVCVCEGGRGRGGCIGRGGGTPPPPRPLKGAQPMPSHCLPNGKCQLHWHL